MKIPYCVILAWLIAVSCKNQPIDTIDRYALVNRHHVVLSSIDSLNSLTVGNGDFACTVDITGLQTFPDYYIKGIPLGTLSNWCWHSSPNPGGYHHEQVVKYFKLDGREVGYYYDFRGEQDSERAKASAWLRENPHRMNLGLLGMKLLDGNDKVLGIGAIQHPEQELNLWEGEILSCFEVEGSPVEVTTICHPDRDMVAVRVRSELLRSGRLKFELRFPEADPHWKNMSLWGNDDSHRSRIIASDLHAAIIEHTQDTTTYYANLSFSEGDVAEAGPHRYVLSPSGEHESITFCCEYRRTPDQPEDHPDFDDVRLKTRESWRVFWESGGAVDFSGCTDPRAFELERRVVLSRYLTQVQCSGDLPPQETGLTYNSWYGKFHMEMHWWHGVHFALWQREHTLEKQMKFYGDIEEAALHLAEDQGYEGIRWPKMTGPDGITSPSTIGNFLIWQQPHYIYFAEMLYRFAEDRTAVLKNHGDLVFKTADFMASFPVFDSTGNRYVLAPPLMPAQETLEAVSTLNPSFELVYWYWAIQTAIQWKKRLGLPVPAGWEDMVRRISHLPVRDSCYLVAENATDSYSNERTLSDHPMVLGIMGMLPSTDLVDPVILNNTFDKVVSSWNWATTWGWDFPMMAMAAGALGRPDDAIDILLMETRKNSYLANGHNYQDERLTIYLPANGGLLTAVARLCTKDQFPRNRQWNVKWENLNDF
jgi:hypothetical protein